MKRKIVILVDGENISAKNAKQIIAMTDHFGSNAERKVYHLQKDPATRAWTEKSRGGSYKDIQLYGPPAKNKVDRKMQKDARRYLQNPDITRVYVVTSDSGFQCLADDAAAGKKLCFIGGRQPSRRLRKTCAQFMHLK